MASTPGTPAAGAPPSRSVPDGAARHSLRRVLVYVAATRFLLWVASYVAVQLEHPELHARARHDFGPLSTVAAWLRWDVWWYVSVVETGYVFHAKTASNVAFLPGFPLLISLLRPIIPHPAIAGLVIANASFLAAVLVLFSWVSERAGLAAAERAVLALLLYPLSFFMNTAYAEAPFFLATVLALRAADRERWRSAASFAALAATLRPMGLFLAPAFAVGVYRARRAGRPAHGGVLAVVLPIAAVGAYGLYLWVRHGTPFAIVTAQQLGWGVGDALGSFVLARRDSTARAVLDLLNLALPVGLIFLTLRAWRRLGPIAGIYSALSAGLGIALGGDSLAREALAVVPVFAAAGIGSRERLPGWILWAPALGLLVVFTYAFAIGRFMG